ncbi:hypothetical protein Brsp02_04295 [Brucella sp. NBRC 113783]
MVVPFALSVEIALVVFQTSRITGAVVLLAATIWYLACLTRWSTNDGVSSTPKAFARALGTLVFGALGFMTIVVVVPLAIVQRCVQYSSPKAPFDRTRSRFPCEALGPFTEFNDLDLLHQLVA